MNKAICLNCEKEFDLDDGGYTLSNDYLGEVKTYCSNECLKKDLI